MLEKGYSKRVLKKVALKGVLQGDTEKGYSTVWGTTEQWPVWYGSISGTHGAHTQRLPCSAAPAGVLPCITRERARMCTGTARGLRQKGASRVLTRYSHGTHTVLRYPAEHAALLRVLVAAALGRSGQCTAVWGNRA